MSDIQIVVGHKSFFAHKLVLCCSSDVLKVMLTQPQWLDSQRDRIVLMEEPACIHVFDIFMQYFYSGCIHLDHCNVLPVLMLADKYNVTDLREICLTYMENHLVSVVKYNRAVSWYQYAKLCGHNELANTCQNFIKWNFQKVSSTEDFLLLEYEFLLQFLQDSDLVVPDEYVLYEALQRWLSFNYVQYNSSHMNQSLEQEAILHLVSCIRFPMMHQDMLQLLDNDPFATQFQDFFIEKVGLAVLYHTSKRIDRQLFPGATNGCYDHVTPRNYTNDMWSSTLLIDNYSALPPHDVRPLIFSSPVSGSEADENKCWEWNIDFYPKGVQFQKCMMIGLWRNLEVCGVTYPTVRLVMEAKTPERRHVDISILVAGVQDGVEYIKNVVHRRCCFDKTNRLFNMDNILPFDDLNSTNANVRSSCLTGSNGDELKIQIVVKPL